VQGIDAWADSERLVDFLLDPQPRAPVVVISVREGMLIPPIDADSVAAALKDIAPVFVVPAAETFGITQGLGASALSAF
jgi:hypothetical protein